VKKFCLALLLSLGFGLTNCSDKSDPDNTAFPSNTVTIPERGVSRFETPQDFDPLLAQLGPARYALLGEASHGTSEFYTQRAALTKRLIEEKGFTLIGVEGDWPELYELNRYVKGANNGASAAAVLQRLKRWPTWLWANQEVADFAEWLRTYNRTQPADRQVGFYGLDLYSLWPSLESIRTDFADADPATRNAVSAALECLSAYRSEEEYGRATTTGTNCAAAVAQVLAAVQNRRQALPPGHEGAFNAEQNALVAVNAERYYRTSARSYSASWNVRDQHMVETINRLMSFYGPNAKIAVWEHNTHVGDARHTDMAASGLVNVGQLVREQHAAEGVYVVGMGTYAGTVIAAPYWGGPVTTMTVPAAKAGSWEAILHAQRPGNSLLLLDTWRGSGNLSQRRGNRAIGVQYDPNNEAGNYVPTDLPHRYDAFLFIEQTTGLRPLPAPSGGRQLPPQVRASEVVRAENF
jgi:erythromycin esterase-like protein